jgi:hypothetical protein
MLTKQYALWVWVDGVNFGSSSWWDTFTGGGMDSDEVKYHPGSMAEVISLGGTQEVDNCVVGRLYTIGRDDWVVGPLLHRCGKSQMQIAKYSLDRDGNVWGFPLIYLGTLKRCTPPEMDSNATDAAIIELEMSSARVWQG